MSLASDEVHLHFAYPGRITDPGLLRRYQSLLSGDELVQMSHFFSDRHRHQYLVTRALVRTTLSAYYQVEPAEWKFTHNPFGKPGVTYPDQQLPIRFNLSHTNGLVMCGVVRGYDIGVDVEDLQRSTHSTYESLSRYFSKREIEDLLELPVTQKKQRFFDYWTLKESYIKARGMGLSIPLHKFSFLFQGNRLSEFSIHPDLNDSARSWRFWRTQIDGRYLIAVATKSTDNDLVLSAVNSVPLQNSKPIPLVFL